MTVYAVLHLSGSMIFNEAGENLPSSTSYQKTIDLLKRIAFYAKKKGGCPLITYIGKRMVLQSDMKHEDSNRESQKILLDMAFLNDQLETLAKEHAITTEDTILLFSTAGDYLANVANKPPCHMQLILTDLVYDAINKNEYADLQKLVDLSLDEQTKTVRAKEFKTLHFCKAKPGEILYRLLKDHFIPFTVRIWVGRMKQNVTLSPKCPEIPKGHLHCVGFVKTSSLLNMPVLSKHAIVPSTLISITRKEFKEQEKKKPKKRKRKLTVAKKISNQKCKKKYLPLMYILKDSLIKEDCVAIARFISGQYCAIYAIKEDTEAEVPEQYGLALLDVMQEFDFDKLVPKLEPAKGKDDGVQDMHNNKLWDYTPSYINQTEKCWTSSQGMNVDLQKAVRLLKKLPEKPENLYAEINRMRDYAILLGMFDFVQTLAEILKTQIATLSEPAQVHANHIVNFLEKPIVAFQYEPLMMYEAPSKTQPRIIPESRLDRDERVPQDQDIRANRQDRDHRHREDRHYDRHRRYR